MQISWDPNLGSLISDCGLSLQGEGKNSGIKDFWARQDHRCLCGNDTITLEALTSFLRPRAGAFLSQN